LGTRRGKGPCRGRGRPQVASREAADLGTPTAQRQQDQRDLAEGHGWRGRGAGRGREAGAGAAAAAAAARAQGGGAEAAGSDRAVAACRASKQGIEQKEEDVAGAGQAGSWRVTEPENLGAGSSRHSGCARSGRARACAEPGSGRHAFLGFLQEDAQAPAIGAAARMAWRRPGQEGPLLVRCLPFSSPSNMTGDFTQGLARRCSSHIKGSHRRRRRRRQRRAAK
jgi:hypothetical protein